MRTALGWIGGIAGWLSLWIAADPPIFSWQALLIFVGVMLILIGRDIRGAA